MALADTPYITVPWTAPASDLTDYVGYYDLSNAPQSWWDEVDTSDGTKLRVAKDDQPANNTTATELAFEVVDFDDVAQTGQLWFRWSGTLPSSSPDDVRIYAAKSSYTSYGATDTFGRNAVWVNFDLVFHLNEDPSGSAPQFINATGGGNDGSSVGTMTSGDLVTGKIGDAIQFDGSDDRINLSNDLFNSPANYTISAWALSDSDGQTGGIAGKWSGNNGYALISRLGEHSAYHNGSPYDALSSGSSMSETVFEKMKATWDGTSGDRVMYMNGAQVNTDNRATLDATTNDAWEIGAYNSATFFAGIIDEVRFSQDVHSADWETLEYANQDDPATFWGTPTFVAAGGGGMTLESNDLQSINELEQSALTVSYALGGNNLQSLNQLQQSGLNVDYSLGGNNLQSLNQLTQSGLDVNYALSPNGLESLNQIQQSGLTVLYSLSPNSLQNVNELTQSGLGTGVQLSPNEVQSLNQLTQSGLTVAYVLSPEDMQSVGELEQSAVDVLYSLLPNAVESQNTLEQSAVTVNYGLTPNTLENINELQQAALTPFYVIDPSNLENINEVESTVLGTIGQATKVSLDAKELYIIDLQAKKLYTITTDEKELYTITLDSKEVID